MLKNDPDLINKTLLVNGTPIWVLIFYLIRAGLYLEADEWFNVVNSSTSLTKFPCLRKELCGKH